MPISYWAALETTQSISDVNVATNRIVLMSAYWMPKLYRTPCME